MVRAPALLLLMLAAAAASAAAAGRALPRRALLASAGGECATLPLGWNVLLRTGDTGHTKDSVLGLMVDEEGDTVTATMADGATEPHISTQPDFTSLLTAPDGSLWVVSQFEQPQPSVVYLIGVEQDKATGKLTPKSLEPVDFSEFGGVWITCAGSVTPWGTHMGGEEYEPDARMLAEATSIDGEEETSLASVESDTADNILSYLRYWGLPRENVTMDQIRAEFNPYLFGWVFEVAVQGGGNYSVSKHYAMGRTAKEMAYVMPDNKTVYHTDDGDQVGFYKFVADKPSDMSSGTLYGAKAEQTSAENGGSFEITWIELGSGKQEDIKALVDTLTFPDIFETATPDGNGTCPDGFTSTNAGIYNQECLKLMPGMEKAAAFLETRRYLAYLGGTTEFSKWEGITFSPARMEGYTSMSDVRHGMEDFQKKGEPDNTYDVGGNNDIRLPYNKCGCVYMLEADESYSFTSMTALVCGYSNPDETDEANSCALDSISNPDNLSVADELDILFIGEDTSSHQNDFVWSYDLNTGNMTRIFTSVYGAETTSVYWYPDVNGWSYLMSVVQHPYVETDEDKVDNPYSEGPDGYIGYFTMPAAETAGKTLRFEEVPVPQDDQGKSTNTGSQTVQVCPKEGSGPTVLSIL